MKKKLTKFSMALVAATLFFTNAFGAEPPQAWVQEIQVDQAISVSIVRIGSNHLTMCSGDVITFTADGPANTFAISVGANSVTVNAYGEGNLSAIFQVKKNGIPLASAQEYIDMGFPALASLDGWIQADLTMKYPITALNTSVIYSLSMPTLDSGTTYRYEFLYITSDSPGCDDFPIPASSDSYAEILVHPMPRLTYSGTATDHMLSVCEGDSFVFKVKEREIELMALSTGKSFKFNCIGDAGTDSLLNGHSLMKLHYSLTKDNGPTTGLGIPPEFDSPIVIAPLTSAVLPPGWVLPAEGITLKLPTPDEGLYFLKIDSISSYGCTYHTQPADSAFIALMVYPELGVTASTTNHDLELCAGDTLSFTVNNRQIVMSDSKPSTTDINFDFTGFDPTCMIQMHYTIAPDTTPCNPTPVTMTSNTLGTTPTLPDSIPIATLPASMPPNTPPFYGQTVKVVIGQTPGKYHLTIDSLTTASGCVKKSFPDGYADILVRPLPTIAFPTDPVCQDGNLLITLTGACDVTSFFVDYKYTKHPNTNPATDLITPTGAPGLSQNFNNFVTALPADVDENGVKTFKQGVTTGEAGLFKFYLKSVFDGFCTRTNPTPLW